MTTRPLLLDLFCGAGGAAMGYHRAGFDVIGVDIEPQPNYPFEFWQDDALAFLRNVIRRDGMTCDGRAVAANHASPPCQRWSAMSKCRPALAGKYPDLITPLRPLLIDCGVPYVIENVPGAPLLSPIMLCGTMFDRELYRHRLFESSFEIGQPDHYTHEIPASKAGHWTLGTVMSVSGHIAPIAHARRIMGIDWTNRAELAESIPPDYTEFIGSQLMLQAS